MDGIAREEMSREDGKGVHIGSREGLIRILRFVGGMTGFVSGRGGKCHFRSGMGSLVGDEKRLTAILAAFYLLERPCWTS